MGRGRPVNGYTSITHRTTETGGVNATGFLFTSQPSSKNMEPNKLSRGDTACLIGSEFSSTSTFRLVWVDMVGSRVDEVG